MSTQNRGSRQSEYQRSIAGAGNVRPGGDDRVLPTLCIVKLVGPNGDQLMRARNVSAGGMMCEVGRPVSIGDKVELEFNSQKIPSTVIWIRDATAGCDSARRLARLRQDDDGGEARAPP